MQGEAFDFATPVGIDGAVEVWMSAVEKEMRTTLHRSVFIACIAAVESVRSLHTARVLGLLMLTHMACTAQELHATEERPAT